MTAGELLARPPPPADARHAYGPLPKQFGDLRLPAGAGPHPVVVVLHGGFWRAENDLLHLGHACAALTAAGLATWNLEYRGVGDPDGTWPTPLEDAAAGTRHLATLGHPAIDLTRVVLLGFSAGGQLAVSVAADLARSPELGLRLRGVVSLAGLLDLREAARLGLHHGAVDDLLAGSPETRDARLAAASPIEGRLPPVPVILVHGDADETVPVSMSVAYDAAMRRGDVTLRVVEGASHFDLIDPASAAWPVVVAAVRALA